MMRDADATEKRKRMLPWFCEEEYTKKPVGAVCHARECSCESAAGRRIHETCRCFTHSQRSFALSLLALAACVLQIPAVKLIYQFLKQVFEVGQFNPEYVSLTALQRMQDCLMTPPRCLMRNFGLSS